MRTTTEDPDGIPRLSVRPGRRAWLAILAGLLLPVAALLPEALRFTPDLNDGAFHLGVARATVDRLTQGDNPLDFWLPTWLAGYPLFHHYQPAPYLVLALLHLVTAGKIALGTLLRLLTLVALAAFPVANWIALRRLGRSRTVAAAGAAVAFLVSADRRYGIELESFTWYGWGLFTQAVALPLLPVAAAAAFRALETRGSLLRIAALVAVTTLCHVLYGYVAALGILPALAVGLTPLAGLGSRLRRAAVLLAEVGLLLAFFVVPLLRDSPWHATSLYDPATKFDSWGATTILGWLLGGDLLDHGRLPVLGALAAVGLFAAVRDGWTKGDRAAAWIAASFAFWTALYFGRPTWGGLVDWLPLGRGLHLERLSSAVHLFALWLAAIGLGEAIAFLRRKDAAPALRSAIAIAIAIGLASAAMERTRYVVRNANGAGDARAAWERESPDLAPILAHLRAHPGRVHAGGKGNWGQETGIGGVPLYQVLSAEGLPTIGHAPFSWAMTTDFQVQVAMPTRESAGLWNIEYLLGDDRVSAPAGAEVVVRSGRFRLWRLPNDGPFSVVRVPVAVDGDFTRSWSMTQAWVGSRWASSANHAQLSFDGRGIGERPVLRMSDPWHFVQEDQATPRSVFDSPGIFGTDPAPPAKATLSGARVEAGLAEVTVDAEAPASVLFRDTFHPGWRATLDGSPVPTMAVTPGMIAVDVPAGRHVLRLEYAAGILEWILLLLGPVAALLVDRWFAVDAAPRSRAQVGG